MMKLRIALGIVFMTLVMALMQGCTAHGTSAGDVRNEESSPAVSEKNTFVLNEKTRNYDQLHLRAEMLPDFEKEQASIHSTLTLRPLVDGFQSMVLHSLDCEFQSIQCNGQVVDYQHNGDQLELTLPATYSTTDTLTLEFEYMTRPTMGLFFKYPTTAHAHVPRQLWTQGEGTSNRNWLPCYDLPDDRLTSEILVTVPAGMKVISNGQPVAVETVPGGVRHHWRMEQEHVSYLISVIAGEFDEVKHRMEDGLELFYYLPPGQADKAELAFGETPDMMAFFPQYTGQAYPYPRYSQTPVWDFLWGGMENTGATTLNRRCIHDERAHLDYSADYLVAHELAHMWFGDLITCQTFDHIWLNEGFATYFTDLFIEHDRGADAFQVRRLQNNDRYFSYSPLNKVKELKLGADTTTPGELTTAQYQKGSAVLHMLRLVMGEEAFQRGVQLYVKRCANRSVVTEELRAAMEESYGQSLDWFFDQWVYKGVGYPIFNVSYHYNPDDNTLSLQATQMQPVGGKFPLYRMPVRVGVYIDGTWTQHSLDIQTRDQHWTLPCKSQPESVIFDSGTWLLKKMHFKKSVQDWGIQLLEAPHVANRIEAARALAHFDFAAVSLLVRCSRQDAVAEVRVAAVKALNRIQSGPALAGLMDELNSRNGSITKALEADDNYLEAIQLLRRIRRLQHKYSRENDHFNFLINAQADESSKVRIEAVRGMAMYDVKVSGDILIAILENDDSEYVRAEAVLAMASPRSRTIFESIEKASQQESYENIIRQYCMQAFAILGDARALPLAKEYSRYQYGGGGMNRLTQAAIDTYAILQTDRSEAIAFLSENLSHPYFRCRGRALYWLGQLHAWEAISAVEQALILEKNKSIRGTMDRLLKELKPGANAKR